MDAHQTRLSFGVTNPFDFRATACSHGWVDLAPNTWHAPTNTVETTVRLHSGRVVRLSIQPGGKPHAPRIAIVAASADPLKPVDRPAAKAVVRRMFRVDEDLSEFHQICQQRGAPWDRLPPGAGRLLRSPSLFEDIVKTICTTNIQWAGTRSMVSNLVAQFGETYPPAPEHKTFPSPEALAAATPEGLKEARLGYRASYILELAQQVSGGQLNLASLEDESLPAAEARQRLLGIKGIGSYAAGTLLMLLGYYEHPAFDTLMRDFIARKYLDGRRPTEAEALAVYQDWGKWQFLAYWFDVLAG